jgi:SOS-response transcriptional repressor LexA
MTTLAKRIEDEMNRCKLSQTSLAQKAKVSQTIIHKLITGKALETRKISKIAAALGVNTDWLASGTGEKFTTKSGELFNVEQLSKRCSYVPLISWVQAGEWKEAIDNYAVGDAEEWLLCPVSHGKKTYALRVKGDSMTSPYPGNISYPEGVIIFVDPEKEITSGCRIIAKLSNSNEVTFKEYREDAGKHFLRPLNPQYQMQEISNDTHLCGVVIGQFMSE